jgi:hypothetical protein
MDWTAVIPAACGALLGGTLSFLGGSWQASRTATRQRQAEIRKRSEDSAAEAMEILQDIRKTAEENPEKDGAYPSFWLSSEGTEIVNARVLDLRRSARLITNAELQERIKSAAAYLSAPSEFQHLEGEAVVMTARRMETWISDNVTSYLTDAALPDLPDDIKSYEDSYQEACTIAEESWQAQQLWHKEERDRQRKAHEEKAE